MKKIKQTATRADGFEIISIVVGIAVIALGGLLGYTGIVQYERYSAEQKNAAEDKRKADDIAYVKQRIDTYVNSVYFENTSEMVERNDKSGASQALSRSATGKLKEQLENADDFGRDSVICTSAIESLKKLSYEIEKNDDQGAQIAVRGTGSTATWDVALISLTRNNQTRQLTDIECAMKIRYDELGTTREEFKAAMDETSPENTP